MDIKARNKQIKTILSKEFGSKNVSVTGGRGTAYGWVGISIKATDPCPYKQDENPCSSYILCSDGICKGNNQIINGGWGNTVRQLLFTQIHDKVEALIKDIEMHHFYSDDYSDSTPRTCCNIDVDFIRAVQS